MQGVGKKKKENKKEWESQMKLGGKERYIVVWKTGVWNWTLFIKQRI